MPRQGELRPESPLLRFRGDVACVHPVQSELTDCLRARQRRLARGKRLPARRPHECLQLLIEHRARAGPRSRLRGQRNGRQKQAGSADPAALALVTLARIPDAGDLGRSDFVMAAT